MNIFEYENIWAQVKRRAKRLDTVLMATIFARDPVMHGNVCNLHVFNEIMCNLESFY
jgi:hypothetical protein